MTGTAPGAGPRRSLPGAWALGVLAVTVPVGYVLVLVALPVVHGRSFLWLAGRALGLAAYVAMVLLVVLGTWLRHPARRRVPGPHPETQLRLHAALAGATVVLLAGHVTALAADRYAGVGWAGAVVPGAAAYRPWPVAAGVVAAYGVLAVVGTAALGGRLVGRRWLAVHRLTVPVFGLVWFHAVLAGTDAPRLRVVYALSGVVVVAVVAWRLVAGAPSAGHAAARPSSATGGHAPDGAARPQAPPAPGLDRDIRPARLLGPSADAPAASGFGGGAGARRARGAGAPARRWQR